MYAIYIITNTINAMQYVGVTSNIKGRWYQHKKANGSSKYLHTSIKKYGIENFVFTHVADAFSWENALEIEMMLIKQHNTKAPNGYNLTDGGQGTIGYKWSDDSRKKIRDINIGKKLSEETKKKQSLAHVGNKYNLGKKASNETKAKMSAIRLGKKHTQESKRKMSIASLGKKHSEETKKYLQEINVGKKHTKEAKEKIRLAGIGRKLSPDAIAKRTATRAINRAKKLALQKENV